jgi:MFS family permease
MASQFHYAPLTQNNDSLTASLSTLFIEIYGLNEWEAGLIYLPFALGGTASTLFSGHLLDKAYRKARTKRRLMTDRINGDDLDNFPIEKARLSVMWIPMLLITLCTVAYGWVLQYKQVFTLEFS